MMPIAQSVPRKCVLLLGLATAVSGLGGCAEITVPDAGLDAGASDAGVDAGASLECTSGFAPVGCRAVPSSSPALPSRNAWRNLHADITGSDEVPIVIGPTFEEAWAAEPNTFNVTGPVFDSNGNLYFSPLSPAEDVVLIALDATDGSRRFAIENTTDARSGGGAPAIFVDPATGEEQVFLGLYDRVLAISIDGATIWDEPTGLTPPTGEFGDAVFGVNLHPQTDALIGLTRDGFVYVHDRASGEPRLSTPFQLPGEPSPAGEMRTIPEPVLIALGVQLAPLISGSGADSGDLLNALLGSEIEVANFFSIDPHSGTAWIAATAPDDEDGTVDGVSELGALYALELVADGDDLRIEERCHATFTGGSASTPALRVDGGRVYVGDNAGALIAVESDCSEAWRVEIGAQVIGSIAVSSDGGALYAATTALVVRVDDEGSTGVERWRVRPVTPGFAMAGEMTFNMNLVAIAENGLAFQAGAGVELNGTPMVRTVGIGIMDRETGEVRSFVEGLEETVAVISTGPNGGLYVGSSPLRRAIYRAVFGLDMAEPLRGGITAFRPADPTATLVDALCAAQRRAENAATVESTCPDSVEVDRTVIRGVLGQARGALEMAELETDQRAAVGAAIEEAERGLGDDLTGAASALESALNRLQR